MLTDAQRQQLVRLVDGEMQYLPETPQACMFENEAEAEALIRELEALPVAEEQFQGECPSCRRLRPAISPEGILAVGSVCPSCGHVEPPETED